MSEWRTDWENAPKDGTPVLLYGPWSWWHDDEPTLRAGVGYFPDWQDKNDPEWFAVSDNPYEDRIIPTHWMHIPKLPTDAP